MKLFQLLFVTLLTNVFMAAAQNNGGNNGDDDCAAHKEHCVADCRSKGVTGAPVSNRPPPTLSLEQSDQAHRPLPASALRLDKRVQIQDVVGRRGPLVGAGQPVYMGKTGDFPMDRSILLQHTLF
ncbi:hypothetical protein PspLS_09853 [Pyricularia sp. CBS 133598]|nr:hypothetical protein PspLS_09853 [Pyricularia sp. CBS 133598]